MNNKELKPCPFCGWDAEINECQSGDNDSIYYRVSCTNEKCSLGYPDAWYEHKIELVRDWNTRHTQESTWQTVEQWEAENGRDYIGNDPCWMKSTYSNGWYLGTYNQYLLDKKDLKDRLNGVVPIIGKGAPPEDLDI